MKNSKTTFSPNYIIIICELRLSHIEEGGIEIVVLNWDWFFYQKVSVFCNNLGFAKDKVHLQ